MSANEMSPNFGEQLSALMDGELPRDETRFLLRRLDADQDLARSWSNYQIASDVLKKRFATPMRADFAASVLQAVVVEKQGTARGGLLRWAGGGAIAAAVAVVALTATRPPDSTQTGQSPITLQTAATPSRTDVQNQASTLPNFPAYDFTSAASFDLSDDHAPPAGVVSMPVYSRVYNGTGRLAEFGPYVLISAPQKPAAEPAPATH